MFKTDLSKNNPMWYLKIQPNSIKLSANNNNLQFIQFHLYFQLRTL